MLPQGTVFCSAEKRGRFAKHEPLLRIFHNLRFNAIFYVFLIISPHPHTLFHSVAHIFFN